MKRSVRPLFSILLLIVIAVTLCCRLLIHRRGGGGGGFSSHELGTNAIAHPPASVFNPTLLKYAAIDVGEAEAKKEIEGLLDDGLSSEGRYKTFATWRMWFNSHNTYTNGSSHRKTIGVLLRSPEFYRFWLEFRRLLQEWDRKRGFQADIMNELIQLVKIPIDRHNGLVDSNRRYNSCAVVGNSGILLQREYGKLIDEHEVVIRLNNAKTEKFDRNVGSKTHVSFVNSNILHFCSRSKGCFCHPYGPNVPMVMYICQPIHFMDYSICNSSHKEAAPLIVTDPRFDALCARIVKYYSLNRFVQETGKSLDEWSPVHDGPWFHYSSGFQAVMLAVGICEKVSIFGFGKSASAKHHYHTDQKAELRSHDYEAEYDVYDDLVKNPQAIPFVSDKFRFPPVVIYQ